METSQQIDILKQKNLKPLNSYNDCCEVGVGATPLSHSYNSELINEKIFDRKFKRAIKKEIKLILKMKRDDEYYNRSPLDCNYKFDKKILFENTISLVSDNFENLQFSNVFLWGYKNWIKERDIIAVDKFDKEGNIIRLSDLDKNGELKKHLKTIKKNGIIKILYTRWGHWALGFKRRPDLPDRLQLENFRVQLNKFLKAIREELNLYIKGVGIRDIAYDIEKIGDEYYFHFHIALRPFHTTDKILEKINKIGERFGIKPNFIGYRECYILADYFAKRHSGQFEHEATGTNWMYKDIMDIETYFRLFYNSRKLIHTGFTNKELIFLKKRFKQELKDLNQTLEESLLSPKDKEQSRCPECNSTNLIFDFCKKCDIKDLKPPDRTPEAPEEPIEHIKYQLQNPTTPTILCKKNKKKK